MDVWPGADPGAGHPAAGASPALAIAPAGRGRVGPNAVTRTAEALQRRHGAALCARVFAAAGLVSHLLAPPSEMVDEDDVGQLQAGLRRVLPAAEARLVAREAGILTGDYLLAHRIPVLVQRLLRILPRGLAARILARAIARHAWTFAGSGTFSVSRPSPLAPALTLQIRGSPLCRFVRSPEPSCDYFAATFERVFSAMLGPTVRVTETECELAGADACRFILRW